MTITCEQVADLQPGDVVEMRSAEDVLIRGRLMSYRGPAGDQWEGLSLGPGLVLRRTNGGVAQGWLDGGWALTVVSRAPRPLYVNHPRTEPVPGDVVRIEFVDADDADNYTDVYEPTTNPNRPWMDPRDGSRYTSEQALPSAPTQGVVRLLVDGETGQVVQ